jgi:NTP pyrophosphatase (non-canonical NTP hydrolase)
MELNNSELKTFLKCLEELSELALELTHAVNKPSKNNSKKISGEIKDVEGQISSLKKILKNKP